VVKIVIVPAGTVDLRVEKILRIDHIISFEVEPGFFQKGFQARPEVYATKSCIEIEIRLASKAPLT
jgi:hypothetical protein